MLLHKGVFGQQEENGNTVISDNTEELPVTDSVLGELRNVADLTNDLKEARELLLISVKLIVQQTTLSLTDGISGEYLNMVGEFLDRTK